MRDIKPHEPQRLQAYRQMEVDLSLQQLSSASPIDQVSLQISTIVESVNDG